MSSNKKLYMIPVMFCFFAMGFVDLVGIASNFVKADLGLSDSVANVFPSLVFFWFLIFSVPTGILMNHIGRKNTVQLSLIVTIVSLVLPLFGDSFTLMLLSFSLLGIGNALMQTSLNPLISTVVKGSNLASTLTFGQFVKAIASFLAPYLAMWGASAAIPSFGLGWRALFAIYLVVGILAALLLYLDPIEEEPADKASGFVSCFKLLGRPMVLLSFIGIMCHVGIDVGTNTTAPKILSNRLFFLISVCMMAGGMVIMATSSNELMLDVAFGLVGYGNSNIFSLVFAQALLSEPDKKNEVSGLMIMGLFGGTVFPLIMGFCSDWLGQVGAVLVMAVGVIYLFTYLPRVAK